MRVTQEISYQGLLERTLQLVFPNEFITTNVRLDSSIKDPTNGTFLELDIQIPNHKICFEFQDEHHYTSSWYCHTPVEFVETRDKVKHESIRKNFESLVIVPCWWDGDAESLASTIHFQRPDLIPASHSIPIPLNPTKDHFKKGGIPGIGELMLASFPSYTVSCNVSPDTPWWLGEKYDGVRVCWHPDHQKLYARTGSELEVEEDITDWLSKSFLDGEAWFGRGSFVESQKIVKSVSDSVHWPSFRILAFDVPSVGLSSPFESRYQTLLSNISFENPVVINSPRVLCVTEKQLSLFVENVIGDGGEGAILREPRSLYHHGRTLSLVKVKAMRDDQEAIVVDIESDRTIILKLPNGKTFPVPAQNIELPAKPQKGDIVTFSYDSYSIRELPVNARICRVRSDTSWEEVVRNFRPPDKGFTTQPSGYWKTEQNQKIRKFFENFARKRNMDPLHPATWYDVTRRDIVETKGGGTVLTQLKGGYIHTIRSIFPELGFDESQFSVHSLLEHWKDVKNRRKYFDLFAKHKNFNPLVPDSWYSLTADKFDLKTQSILQFYSGSFMNAAIHLFPEISFDPKKFDEVNYWPKMENKRKFFVDFAKTKGFDPLVPQNWYSVTKESVLSQKGGIEVLSQYENNLHSALFSIFPDIGLEEVRLFHQPQNYWNEKTNRRKFFEEFAHENGFDPLIAENWYKIQKATLEQKGGVGVLSHYNASVSRALMDVFPNIGLDVSKFYKLPHNYWQKKENQKKFFEDFAIENGFDPLIPSNWYLVKSGQLQQRKGAAGVLYFHSGSFAKALTNIFPDIGLEKSRVNLYSPAKQWRPQS